MNIPLAAFFLGHRMSKCKPGSGCCDKCGPITHAAEIGGNVEIKTHDGREVMVVPVVAIVEGVLNGKLVPADEFEAYAASWEGVAVTVGHPQINGQPVTANKPEIIEKTVIGRFHNVKADNKKLKGEIWIDVEKARKLKHDELLNALQKGEKIEVSTAYFADVEEKAGSFNGKNYNGIHRNLRPDHLALLPGDIGACSVADGCGVHQNQHNPASSVGKQLEINTMTKAEKIELLLNKHQFAQTDKAGLELLSEPAIDRLVSNMDEPEKDEPETAEDDEEMEAKKADKPDAEPTANQLDAETLLAINWAKAQYAENKARLVARLSANAQCAFTANELKSMDVAVLAKLDASLSGDYSGRGAPVTNHSHDESPLLANAIVMASPEAKQ